MTNCQLCTVPTDSTSGVCGFCRDYAPPVTEVMADLFDGKHMLEQEIMHPCFVFAGRLTNLEGGLSWRFVYRSPLVTKGAMHREIIEWLDGAVQIGEAEMHPDARMMHGAGELTLWEM